MKRRGTKALSRNIMHNTELEMSSEHDEEDAHFTANNAQISYENTFHSLDGYFYFFSHPIVCTILYLFFSFRVIWWFLLQWEPESISYASRFYFSCLSFLPMLVQLLYMVRFRRPAVAKRSFKDINVRPVMFEFGEIDFSRLPEDDEDGEVVVGHEELSRTVEERSKSTIDEDDFYIESAMMGGDDVKLLSLKDRKLTVLTHMAGVFRKAVEALWSYEGASSSSFPQELAWRTEEALGVLRRRTKAINVTLFFGIFAMVATFASAALRDIVVVFIDHADESKTRKYYNFFGEGNGTYSPHNLPLIGYNISAFSLSQYTNFIGLGSGVEAGLLVGHLLMPFLAFTATATLQKVRMNVFFLRLVRFADIKAEIVEKRMEKYPNLDRKDSRMTRLHKAEREHLIHEIFREYLDIQTDVNDAGELWEPFLGCTLFIAAIMFLVTLYQLLDSKDTAVKTTVFICLAAIACIVVTVVLIVYFNTVCEELERLVNGAHIDHFDELGGREYLLRYFASNPLRFRMFGFSITPSFLAGFASAAGTTFVIAAMKFLDPFNSGN
uniref:Uncharacterized protein n=1 Tax=Palpitomonas bilix TaxID=652834 RepID=A0A7S3G681_9EUKA|mmetsp:Transcript_29177/g.75095  ORF Transcript_29177/g.75095 Transcript_29177/m.75095 type:complete len:553 (+) Transcript_29177:314-1972(+)